ncbi:MAG: ATP-binding cassette domain-containing protein, partial [Paracoccaceae bacterium]
MTPLLQVRDVSKRYGGRIGCAGVSFYLFPGGGLGIVGGNGAGKSTLLYCLAGPLGPGTGGVVFCT